MFKHKSCFKVFNDDTHFSSLYLFIRTINDTMECHYLWRPSTAEDDFLGPSNVAQQIVYDRNNIGIDYWPIFSVFAADSENPLYIPSVLVSADNFFHIGGRTIK